jgi:hypothetical protein
MAIKTQRDEIPFLIPTGVAAKLLVMDFEICHGTAQLASPAIASQYLLAKFPVAFLAGIRDAARLRGEPSGSSLACRVSLEPGIISLARIQTIDCDGLVGHETQPPSA